MWLSSLLASRRSETPQTRADRRRGRRGPGSTRLAVEALEDRTVPAFLAPINTSVDGLVGDPTSNLGQSAAGDFNGDGRTDLATILHTGGGTAPDRSTVRVLLSTGDGNFRAGPDLYPGSDALDLGVGDFNGDGRLDVVARCESGLSLFQGNGDDTFQRARSVSLPRQSRVTLLATDLDVGDLNRDDYLDAVVVSVNGERKRRVGVYNFLTVFLGSASGL